MEIVKSLWLDKICIVGVKTIHFGVRYYIGIGNISNKEIYELKIAKKGREVTEDTFFDFFNKIVVNNNLNK
jgi:hypothetical protein